MTFYVRVRENEEIPRGYGLAWWDMRCAHKICAPIGLNVLVGAMRRLWHVLVRGVKPSAFDRTIAEARLDGWRDGQRFNEAITRWRVRQEIDQEDREHLARYLEKLKS